MSPLALFVAGVAAFAAGFWLGGIALCWLLDRHASRALRVPNGATRAPSRVAPQRRSEPWGRR